MSTQSPDKRLFTARMVCFNKNKDGSAPCTSEIRGIAVTGLLQKMIEHHLLHLMLQETIHLISKA